MLTVATFGSYPSKSTIRGANLTFWAVFKRSYAAAWSFVFALPLIAAITVGVEELRVKVSARPRATAIHLDLNGH